MNNGQNNSLFDNERNSTKLEYEMRQIRLEENIETKSTATVTAVSLFPLSPVAVDKTHTSLRRTDLVNEDNKDLENTAHLTQYVSGIPNNKLLVKRCGNLMKKLENNPNYPFSNVYCEYSKTKKQLTYQIQQHQQEIETLKHTFDSLSLWMQEELKKRRLECFSGVSKGIEMSTEKTEIQKKETKKTGRDVCTPPKDRAMEEKERERLSHAPRDHHLSNNYDENQNSYDSSDGCDDSNT